MAGLREHLLRGTFSSVDLVYVFGRRVSTIARQLCLSAEECIDEALIEARRCDQERQEALQRGSVHLLPPLHGIPISVKELVRLIH